MTWTTLEDEATLLDSLAATGRVTVATIGHSVEGRAIRCVRIGIPPPGGGTRVALGILAAQHGDEPAGREAALQFAEYLATTTDPDVTAFLAQRGVWIIPTANPDGFEAGTRQNANNIDINRHHITLAQPETAAIAPVIGATRPMVVVDLHEAFPQSTRNVTFAGPRNVQTHPSVITMSTTLINRMKARASGEGWSNGDYGGGTTGEPAVFVPNAGLRHSVSILVETSRFVDTPVGQTARTAWNYAMCEEALGYLIDGVTTVEATIATAMADKATEGQQASVPFNLISTTLSPPPSGYRLTPGDLDTYSTHLAAFNITSLDDLVPMGQVAQPVIPFLFDPASNYGIVAAEPVHGGGDGPPPGPPGIELPTGTFRPVVEWYGCDLVTGRIIADLPEVTGTISRLLGAYTSSALAVAIPLTGPSSIGDLAFQATLPGRTMIVAVVNDEPCWAGIVLTRQAGTGATMELGCATLEAYLTRRRVRDHTYTQTDEAQIMAGLLGDAGTILGVGHGIGLDIDAPATGTLRDRTYLTRERATVYDRARQLMAVQDGPEFTIELLWGDTTRTWFRKIARIRKRIGIASDQPQAIFETTAGAIFSSQGAAETTYTLTEDYADGRGANYIVAYSSGEGDDQPASIPAIDRSTLDAGWPIYERVFMPSSSIRSQAVLNDHAQRDLALRRHGAITWEIAARWDVYPRLNIDWRLGDDCAWQIMGHRHPKGATGQGRAIGWELDPTAGVVTPILLDPFSDEDEDVA